MAAVVFDCDGVLVDSEPLSQLAWVEAMSHYGVTVTAEEVARFIGGTEAELAAHFSPIAGVDADRLERTAEEMFVQAVGERGVSAYSDAVELARSLTVPRAVASNSFRWRLDTVLGASGLATWIGPSVAGDEVPEPKPAPFVYIEACRVLGVSPDDVLVIEDSVTGIEAARAAGCRVVGVDRGSHPVLNGVQPDLWLESLRPAVG